MFDLQYRKSQILPIWRTLKDLNIQSTHSHLGFDKSSSNLMYIPIAARIPSTNHPQFIMLTDRQFQLPAKPFSSFYLHCLRLEYVAFHQRCLLSALNQIIRGPTYSICSQPMCICIHIWNVSLTPCCNVTSLTTKHEWGGSVRRQNSASVPSSHWLEIFILTLCPPRVVWTSKTLSYCLFWDLNLSIWTLITLYNRPESNTRLRILPLLEIWCWANSLILLVYVGLLITAMPLQPQANCQHKMIQHPVIFHLDGHLQSWVPDKPGTTVLETEGYKNAYWMIIFLILWLIFQLGLVFWSKLTCSPIKSLIH